MTSGPEATTVIGPARGTRPANRRELIVRAASELFYRKGYATVGMGEVAAAVAIGPSALYRHFRGKQDLLATVLGTALTTIDAALAETAADDIGASLAAETLAHRHVGVLWRREGRHLSAEHRAAFRTLTQRILARLTELVRERRPELNAVEADLLARCALAVADSMSFHSLSLPEPGFTALLDELVSAAVDTPIALPEVAANQAGKKRLSMTRSRREAILAEAAKLFARQGFTGVSVDDIGEAVGITGPSVYNHFPGKADILLAVVFRGNEWLRMDMSRAFARASDAGDGLDRLLRSYGGFVAENPDLVQILVSETMHLPDADRHRARAAQHSYIAEWVGLARRVHPDWDPIGARVRVQAAQTVLNELALTTRVRAVPGADAAVLAVGAVLLAIR
ncbi:TetR/AcrR family transcriptional regulator [Nocardia sp. NBC_01327]|uniref:TetR/AcrR family transcriptional regulator n=1 Tax=Nocardia sp. NBC_01327 TaxID=2903593 RepID=UPI002E149BAF|nr:TetR family transcriptional regulator [Nocardia sp. NBC_01327]